MPTSPSLSNEDEPPQLVVIGASAGGIEAVSLVLSALPVPFPAPVVIAQHIGPERPSLLADVLGRRSSLPVRTITEGAQHLQPGVVFVVPANRHVEIIGHEAHLHEDRLPGPKPSVDRLLSTAAAAFGEGLVAVILSGSGSDGAVGARVVKQHGGTVIIEDPRTAKFPGMPQSLPPTTVDAVASLNSIGPLVYDVLRGTVVSTHLGTDHDLDDFLRDVLTRSGIDFANYKQPTIRRRLQRRMLATNMRSLGEYQAYLGTHPDEYQRLIASFLIKVTDFFRDPNLFAHLREHVLPEVIARAQAHGTEIRLWSAGCATGEEAYSLAIILSEAMGDKLTSIPVRLFATDIDAEAVAFARRGTYPVSAVESVDRDLLARYFTEADGEYTVSKPLRSLIIFGQHDLAQRPPFPNMDLILCRNVMIYFTTELQRRALQLFAFSLRDAGYLVLGKAEIASPLSDELRLEDPAMRLYRRHGGSGLIPPPQISELRLAPGMRDVHRQRVPSGRDLSRARQAAQLRTMIDKLSGAFLHAPVGIVIVNATYDIQHINAAARHMLEIIGPGIGQDLVHGSPNGPPRLLEGLVDRAFREGAAVRAEGVEITDVRSGGPRHLDFTCYPCPQSEDSPADLVALLMVDATAYVERCRRLDSDLAGALQKCARLEQAGARLAARNRDLDAANQKLATVNTELQIANAAMVVDNEEVQAAGEEVETLNEELQATNEELETLNEEMQATVEELHTSNEDLQARSLELHELAIARERQRQEAAQAKEHLEVVLASMGSALVVVDSRGRVLMTNEAYEVFQHRYSTAAGGFEAEDPEGQIIPTEQLPHERATRGESFTMEFAVSDKDGNRTWFEAVGAPLRGAIGDGTTPFTGGGVVVIRDVSDRVLRRLQDEFLAVASHELRTPLAALSLYTSSLTRVLDTDAPKERMRYIAKGLVSETRRMGLLVNDLMDVGRLQTGRIPLQLQVLDLTQVLRHAAALARYLAKEQAIHIEVPDGEVRITGDPNRLEQVVMNLMENAIRYAAGPQPIHLRLRVVGQHAEIEVEDHGPGMPPSGIPSVFTRFYRSPRTDRHPKSGLGLGLYIVHHLVVGHDGDIQVRSVPGEGTAFTIRLPLAT